MTTATQTKGKHYTHEIGEASTTNNSLWECRRKKGSARESSESKKVNKSILKCFITPSFKAKLLLNGLLDPSFNLPFALAPHKILWDSGVSRSIYARCALQHQEPKIQNQSRKRAPKKQTESESVKKQCSVNLSFRCSYYRSSNGWEWLYPPSSWLINFTITCSHSTIQRYCLQHSACNLLL